ncbi:DUF421 domain-containing protein [Alicyclobacillus fastidiosus]|uniref:DUF421 domain-containing protein n=1 Tax=Alicyclobacillus fastidiosus TaxID=392011 RepID=A0ABY6ZJ09_9BACL|nr:DUF421 domain-containing protein [Alicyclobacillus fastidiosus]WAH42908.1 DUF421 domain-containing protein [Alicyclobacillus fastidiosus]GMA64851.1 hypothetical protein GCM10025859_52910 [Alicyclobacillus fastidiosus]
MNKIAEVTLESIFAFIALFVLARLMGKRQIAQLSFFDYVTGITLGSIAASLSLDEVKLIQALISLIIWSGSTMFLSWLELKSYKIRVLMDGTAVVVVQNGEILERNLKKVKLTIDEMMQFLRDKNIFKLSDVEFAIFENSGHLTVLKKSELQPLTPKDAGIPVVSEHAPKLLIIDGHVMEQSLQDIGYSKEWLIGEVMKQGGVDFRDVFLAQIDSNGNLYVDLYRDKLKQPQIKQKALLAALLKKIQADFESFALQTENRSAKASYTEMREQLNKLVQTMLPYLKD